MKSKLLLLALLCAAASASAEQVYKWIDAAGVVHYSDAPPPKDTQNVQTVRVSGGDRPHASAAATENNTEAPKDGGGAAPSAAPPAAAGTTAETDLKKKNCQQARANLELLQSNYPVAMGDGKALDDKGRQQQIADTNAQVSFYCR